MNSFFPRCCPWRRRLLMIWFVSLAAVVCAATSFAASARLATKPNVVLVMTDDQGYGDVGFHGNKMIRTPTLDALAKQSVRLTNFHVDPTCSETRSALMTGRYSSRVGVWHTIMGRSILRAGELTMGDVFADNGYRTAMFGKWHLGDNYPFWPENRGFQQVLRHGGGGVGQTPDFWGNDYFDDTYFHNGRPEKQTGYCTDVWFDAALNFIEGNRSQPFFCYIATNAPHGPYNVAEKYSKPYLKQGVPQPMANFYGMITNIDENMDRLLEKLDEWNLSDNTIVIFMTDNGTAAGVRRGRGRPKPGEWPGFNAGMRGQKGSQYEGGHRVPCFIRWPGQLGQPRAIDTLAAHIDLLPTLMQWCGLQLAQPPRFDGTSLAPLISGKDWPRRTLFVHSQRLDHPEKWRKCSVMTDTWRLVDGKELYAIKTDPGQTNDVSDLHGEVVRRLRAEYESWWDSISEHFDQYVRIPLGAEQANPVHLTCHDWHAAKVPWNHGHIRADLQTNGFWAVEVVKDGNYEFTLRARPEGVSHQWKPGKAVLEIGDQKVDVKSSDQADEIVFAVRLKAGKTQLKTTVFEQGRGPRGAYFVKVERTD